jgi:LCP family protein required for cell wall assembly
MSKRLEKKENKFLQRLKSIWTRFTQWWGRLHKAWKIAVISGGSVLVTASLALLIVTLWIRPPEPSDFILNPGRDPEPPDVSGGVIANPGPGNGADVQFKARPGVYTFLLAGVHEGMTDTLMVATLDIEQGTCHILSVPRDTVVARAPRTSRKINSAYSQRRNAWDDEPGIPQLKKEIATLIGYQPQYIALVNYRGFIRLIDAIEGVDFDVPMRMNVPSEGINLQKGMQLLDGNKAMQLVRFRYDPVTGAGYDDYGRMAVQQQFLAAAAKKALAGWTNFPEYIRIAQTNVESDIDWGNLLWFAEQIRKIGMDNVVFNTLPTTTVRRPAEIGGQFYEVVKAEEALALINETINPFTAPIGAELVEYMQLTERRG